jgi:hypothetical protein
MEWSEINNDSRIILVPEWVKVIFNLFADDIDRYMEFYQVVSVIVYGQIERILDRERVTPLIRMEPGWGSIFLNYILTKDPKFLASRLVGGKDDQINSMIDVSTMIFDECNKNPAVIKLRKFYQEDIINQSIWLQDQMKDLISYISTRFEAQGKYI